MKEWLQVIASALFLSAVILLGWYVMFYIWIMSFIFLGWQMSVIIYITLTALAFFIIKKI